MAAEKDCVPEAPLVFVISWVLTVTVVLTLRELFLAFRGLEMAPGQSPPLREMQEAGVPELRGSCRCF